MTGETTSADPRDDGEPDDRLDLAQELARQKEEILRLRDLLIARDAELGAARGRIAHLEASPLHALRAERRLGALVRAVVAGIRGSRE